MFSLIIQGTNINILSDTTVSVDFPLLVSMSTCYYDVQFHPSFNSGLPLNGTGSFMVLPCSGGCMAYFSIYPDATAPLTRTAVNLSSGMAPSNYFWEWGDGTTSFGATPTHIYYSPGYYPICLTISDNNGCVNTYCDSSNYISRMGSPVITVNVILPPTGIPHPDLKTDHFSISPNPACNEIFINNPSVLNEMTIYDMAGKVVLLETKFQQGDFENFLPINISTLPEGIYFMVCKSSGSVAVTKFVVAR